MVIPETNADLDKSAKDIFNKGYVQLDVKTKSASGVWEKLQMTACERRKFMCSVIFHVIATICVVWWLYWLIDRIFDEIRQGILEWPFWTKLVVVAIIFIIGLVIMCVQCKVYIQLWRRLKAYNSKSNICEESPRDM